MNTFEDWYGFADQLIQKAIKNDHQYVLFTVPNNDIGSALWLGFKEMGYKFDQDFQGVKFMIKVLPTTNDI